MPLPAPMDALFYAVLVNLATFAAFAFDKHQARQDGWRIAERSLLLLSAAGGSPAALLARHTLRHKTRKQPFSALLYGILAVQLLLIAAALLAAQGLF